MADNIVDLTGPDPSVPLARPPPKTILSRALETSIVSATPERLRQTFSEICQNILDARTMAESILLVNERDASRKHVERDCDEHGVVLDEDTEDEETPSEESSSGEDGDGFLPKMTGNFRPQRRPRYAICENCEEEYDVTTNDELSCQWHEGAPVASCLTSTILTRW